jgi:DNA (cytosine-5)-methyltransferase 1
LIKRLNAENRAPCTIVLENVTGLLSSHGGADIAAIRAAFEREGYAHATATIDAKHFVPQSRPRIFIVGASAELRINVENLVDRAIAALPVCNTRLIDILDAGEPCRSAEETAEVFALMAPRHLAKLEEMRHAGRWVARTQFRRRRPDGSGGKIQRAEIRDDEIAGALRTAAGGSSLQSIVAVDGSAIRTRLLSPREAARLMGLGDDYRLPVNDRDAYDLVGDGVVVPVVRYLAEHVLEPILLPRGSQGRQGGRLRSANAAESDQGSGARLFASASQSSVRASVKSPPRVMIPAAGQVQTGAKSR